MTPVVIEKKWRRHDDLAVTVNDAAPWNAHLGNCCLNADYSHVHIYLGWAVVRVVFYDPVTNKTYFIG